LILRSGRIATQDGAAGKGGAALVLLRVIEGDRARPPLLAHGRASPLAPKPVTRRPRNPNVVGLLLRIETATRDPRPEIRMFASAFLREYGDVAFKILADIEMHRWWVNRDS
jgi:hypothetical protein